MRDLHANKSVAMHIGLINFQYVLQQGMNYYFGEAPYVLTDGYRTGALMRPSKTRPKKPTFRSRGK
jgi:hypothetical protein